MHYSTIDIQRMLLQKGYDVGPVDGFMGPQTEAAIIQFKKDVGLRPRPYVGPITLAALFERRMPNENALSQDPPWLKVAKSYLGLREYPGSKHNPKILEWWTLIRKPFTDDETPWCAGYVGGVLEECGIRSTRSAAARSYRWSDWGIQLDGPAVGAIVVFWRKKRKGPYGHVGFVAGVDQRGNLMVLGGNQGNKVSIKPFSKNRILSFHYPASAPLPRTGYQYLPVIRSDGRLSRNEA